MPSNQLFEEQITCPYCSETISVLIDGSEADQQYVEDCEVCCQPMLLTLSLAADGVLLTLEVRREND